MNAHDEWLEWLKIAPMSQLMESLGTREKLYYQQPIAAEIELVKLREEMRAIRAEMKRRNGE